MEFWLQQVVERCRLPVETASSRVCLVHFTGAITKQDEAGGRCGTFHLGAVLPWEGEEVEGILFPQLRFQGGWPYRTGAVPQVR